jgi:tRNA pseudouridine55 synthase
MSAQSGLLLVDKPMGVTSHDVVARARRALHTRAIGHAGTLDPMATGLLILGVDQATRMTEYLLGLDKRYDATIRLGQRTNTDDAEGEVIDTRPVPDLTQIDLPGLLRPFTGPIQQIPPQFSAIKKDGQRAYALARKGETVELASREVVIHTISAAHIADDPTALTLQVHCGSGTYIRSLARDIGEVLGCGGHLTALRRTSIGGFSLSDAVPMTVDGFAGDPRPHLLAMDRAAAHLPEYRLDADCARRLLLGQSVKVDPTGPTGEVRVYDPTGRFIAMARAAHGQLRPAKVFLPEPL